MDSLARRTTAALVIVAVMAIGRPPLTKTLLSPQLVNVETISITSKHRMLGQEVLKQTLVLQQTPRETELSERQKAMLDRIDETLSEWGDAHETLRTQLERWPDLTSAMLYDQLDTHFRIMSDSCRNVLVARAQDEAIFRRTLDQSSRLLLHHDESFLDVTFALVSSMEEKAGQSAKDLEATERLLLFLTLLVLLFLGGFVFRPAFRAIRQHVATLETLQSDMMSASEGLSRINEDLETALKSLLDDRDIP